MIAQHVFSFRFLALAGFGLASLFASNSYAGGQVIAWGYNGHGQCDVPAEALSRVISIACGGAHSLALKDGKVIAWGTNNYGQCTVPAEALSGVSAIAGGTLHSLALKDGKVIAWGANDYVPAEALSNVSAIAGGWTHHLALKDGKVIAWGTNDYGQCDVPAEALSGVSTIAGGETHSLALKAGKVIAWGNNDYGQCDVPATALSGVSNIAGGSSYSLALKDGKVIVWGYNLHGQCDVPVLGQSGVIAIAAGNWHILALKDKSLKVSNDFDGDSLSDVAIYYPASGQWLVFLTGDGTVLNVTTWGGKNCLPAPGDYDGDGKTDFVVFDSTTATWWVKFSKSGVEDSGIFGQPGTWPVPADYDGDRVTDLGVYDPLTGIWSVLSLSKGWSDSAKFGYFGVVSSLGPQTDKVLPMPFDYDRDGIDDLGYYYRGTNMPTSGGSIFYVGTGILEDYIWGSSGSLLAPGYYQERPANSDKPNSLCAYKILDPDNPAKSCEWGIPNRSVFYMGVYGETLPVPAGDYDGNGFDDNAVYNYVTGEWTIIYNTGGADVVGRTQVSGIFGGPDAVPANIYSTIYALARYSPKPW